MTKDPHAMRLITYHSENAGPGKEWLAYLLLSEFGRLPIAFFATSEEEAKANATAEWDKHRAAREANHIRREENKRKAEAAKERKAKDGKE